MAHKPEDGLSKTALEKLVRKKYGLRWEPMTADNGLPVAPRPDVFIEQDVLRYYKELKRVPGNKLKSWEEHFKTFVSLIWDNEDCQYKFTWNPYAERMLSECLKHRFLGVSGHASSGKSQFGCIWGLANFLISPEDTRVLVTSTSLQESRLRIWGVIEKYWAEAEAYFKRVAMQINSTPSMPGKLVSSLGKITGYQNGRSNDLVGITLIAGGKGNDGDASTKIGFKSMGKLILVADELPLLTHKLYDATSNLLAVDGFQMIGTGNFTSPFDPFGIFTEPKDGWNSVTEDDFGWDTRIGGYCIRFDGEKSPNILAGKEIYKGLLTKRGLAEIEKTHGGNKSPGYYRQVKSFPCPVGLQNMIYSEPELIGNFADHCGPVPWISRPIPLAFLDPAFSKGGDCACACFAFFGRAQINGKEKQILAVSSIINLMQKVDARSKDKDHNEQLADLYIQECNNRGIAIQDRGVDSTGGGDPFSTILAMKMGHGFQTVSFSGAASNRPVSLADTRTGNERFADKVTELWYVGKEFVISGQIRGLDPETMMELINRSYGMVGKRIKVEPKDKMRARTAGRSPDRADAWAGVIEVARRRHGFQASAQAALPAIVPEKYVPVVFPEPKEDKGKRFKDFFATGAEAFHAHDKCAWEDDFR